MKKSNIFWVIVILAVLVFFVSKTLNYGKVNDAKFRHQIALEEMERARVR